jgi:hypothetical protein
LHAVAAVRYVLHAPSRAVLHALRAAFSDELKVDHAALTADFTEASVVWEYACPSAVARALYAAFSAAVRVVIAESIEVSRALTAAPTQAILVAADDVFEVLAGAGAVAVGAPVCANAGAAARAMRLIDTAAAIRFFFIGSDDVSDRK